MHGPSQLKSTICHYVHIFVHNYVHQVFSYWRCSDTLQVESCTDSPVLLLTRSPVPPYGQHQSRSYNNNSEYNFFKKFKINSNYNRYINTNYSKGLKIPPTGMSYDHLAAVSLKTLLVYILPRWTSIPSPQPISNKLREIEEMGQGLSCRPRNEQALFVALQFGDVETVRALLDKDPAARLNHTTTLYDRQSPLHIAAANGQIQVGLPSFLLLSINFLLVGFSFRMPCVFRFFLCFWIVVLILMWSIGTSRWLFSHSYLFFFLL